MNTIEKKSVRVGKYVDNDHVNTVISTYKQERWSYNTERMGKADSLSAWYTVEELEDYIELIKAHGADGIRFYFGAYPENFDEMPEYAGRQTIVLVATKNMDNGNRQANKDLYINDGRKARLLAYNMPQLCPPFCNTQPNPTIPPGTTLKNNKPEIGVTLIDNGKNGMSVI